MLVHYDVNTVTKSFKFLNALIFPSTENIVCPQFVSSPMVQPITKIQITPKLAQDSLRL